MDKIISLIENSTNIVIAAHIDEDADALGSSFALREGLRNIGKKVICCLSREIEHRLKFMGDDYIVYDENTRLDGNDLIICLDSGDERRLGTRGSLLNLLPHSVNIDHHCNNPMYAEANYVIPDLSSTAEIIYNLLCEMNIEITKKIAKYLYCGIMGDTGCLKYSCATSETAEIVSRLMEKGIDHADICRKMFDTEKLSVVKLKGYVMNNIECVYDGQVSLATIDEEIFEKFGVSEQDCGDIVNIPRRIEGTQIAVSIRKTKEKIKISFRSNGKYDVGALAEKFGGGGHKMASGASVKLCDIEEAKKIVMEKIGEHING